MNEITYKLFLVLVMCSNCVRNENQNNQDRESRLVNISQGPIRGYKIDSDVFGFYNVPYASAPTGKNKFKAPLPAPTWLQPFEAVDKGTVCPQPEILVSNLNKTIRDDCLIANIYVPDTEEGNLPVLVYVHGGNFMIGYGDLMTPLSLVKSKKIIGVTFNYRLGVHGFLCLGTNDVPGNAGMKDQVALLHWVKKNIANFGGNPDDVTIAGYSAGSSAVDLLILSESTDGLFHKVIPQSGSNVGVGSVQLDPLENAISYAAILNFTHLDDVYALEHFYKTASHELLSSNLFFDRADSALLFSPCIERDMGNDIFLRDAPVNILKEGRFKKVPMLYGFSNMEGITRVEHFEKWQHEMNKNFADFAPADLEFESEEQKEDIADSIKEFYFSENLVSEETIQGYIDFFTDVLYIYPTLRSLKLQVDAGNNLIYLYRYSFVVELFNELLHPILQKRKVRGAYHCAQNSAVFDSSIFEIPEHVLPDDYKQMMALMKELWLNFIITGKPVPSDSSLPAWPAAGADVSPHMSLGAIVELKGTLLDNRTSFWDRIYDQFYRAPVPPPQPITKHSDL